MKRLTLNELKKGKFSDNIINKLDAIKGGLMAPENKCHLVEIKIDSNGNIRAVYDC